MCITRVIYPFFLAYMLLWGSVCNAASSAIYSDVSNQVTIEALLASKVEFSALNVQLPIAQKLVSTWLRIDVSNTLSAEPRQAIYFDKPIDSQVIFYLVQNNSVVKEVKVGSDNSAPSKLQSIYPHIWYPTNTPDTQVYINIFVPYQVKFDYVIQSQQDFTYHSEQKLFWYGLELGLLYFFSLVFAVTGVISKRKYLIILAAYIGFLTVECSTNSGSIYYYVPEQIAKFLSHFNGSWLVITCVMGLLYHQQFFGVANSKKKLNQVIKVSAALLLLSVLFSFGFYTPMSIQFQALASILTISLMVIIYRDCKQDYPHEALIVAGAWAPMFVLGVVWICMQFGFVTNGSLIGTSKLAIMSHVTLLAFSVYARDKRQKEAFIYYSLHDPDTGLANRFSLNQYLESLLRKNAHHTLLLFRPLVIKSIRLNWGTEQANRHLKSLFERLAVQLERYAAYAVDEQNEKTEIFRLDDSTFAIILQGKLSLSQVEQYACILSSVFEEGTLYKGTRLIDEIEIGVANSPIHAKTADCLIQRALLALSSKSALNDRWQIFDLANSVISQRKMRLASGLKDALDNDGFALYLQPQVNLRTGKVHGSEGLLRWFHPEFGQVPPDEFIPIAESSGLIHLLTEMVFLKGLNYQKHIVEQYPGHVLSLNISGKDLARKELLVHLITLVNELNLNPSQIMIEITESVTIANQQNLKSVLDDYKSVGVKLAIDDFGTGYSSMAYLSHLGFDELKIDKQFVMDIESSSSNQSITKAMTDMAHSLGCKVVAEGVESLESFTRLQHYGVDYAQGYFISKPLEFDEYLPWLYQASQSDEALRFLV